eukprot:4695562-Ditylum_brightwellii.AAC.1
MDEKCMKVKVVKVHKDIFPNLHFTICEEGSAIADNTASECKTIANHLKAQEFPVKNETNSRLTAIQVKATDQKDKILKNSS